MAFLQGVLSAVSAEIETMSHSAVRECEYKCCLLIFNKLSNKFGLCLIGGKYQGRTAGLRGSNGARGRGACELGRGSWGSA